MLKGITKAQNLHIYISHKIRNPRDTPNVEAEVTVYKKAAEV
jgi:hypothetical protein